MKSLFFENLGPYLLGIGICVFWVVSKMQLPHGDDVLSASLTLGAILTGFLATSKAILMTLDSPVMKRIRDTGYVINLASYLGQAIWLTFSFCIICIVGFFIDSTSKYYGDVWIFFAVTSGASFIRVTNIMLKIVKHSPK